MSQTLARPVNLRSRWAQYWELTKPRVVQLIVFCALIGMLLAQPGLPDPARLVPAVAGIWLVAGVAAAFNTPLGGVMFAILLVLMFITLSYGNLGNRHEAVEEHADPHRQHPNKHDHGQGH